MCGKLKERQIDKQRHCFLLNNDSIQDTLKLIFDLEGLRIRDDPVLQERDHAMENFKETVAFENGRYTRRFGHNSELYQQYREIIRDYTEQGIVEEVKTKTTDNELKRPVYYLPHQAVRKEGRSWCSGNQYCLTIIDRFSRWPKVFPTPDMIAETKARALIHGWISRFGCPVIITIYQVLQLPSNLVASGSIDQPPKPTYVTNLIQSMRSLSPVSTAHHGSSKFMSTTQ
ncbi:uncharacterized protein NPIL_678071 [Nephila pilipes]|uniref:Integrase catalytic domain-containing protein n=1 Tax=Nephila pilipes TaxID=299642 RepID=A0A8X6II14_NEPPI|nr:uncharacterized protein NPIL_678071 [Nephila pilipes]